MHRKSIQAITLVHTLLTNPNLECRGKRDIRCVLLLAPKNVLANWQNEFDKWITNNNDIPDFRRYYFNSATSVVSKTHMVENWYSNGGLLCSSPNSFALSLKKEDSTLRKYMLSPGPDREYSFFNVYMYLCTIPFS